LVAFASPVARWVLSSLGQHPSILYRRIQYVYPVKTLSTKVPTELLDRIDSYADDIGETRSLAARRLLRAGLDAETEPATVPVSWVAIYLGSIFGAAAFADAAPEVGAGGLAIAVTGLLAAHPRIQQLATKLNPRYTD
jgi:hypothetical protein